MISKKLARAALAIPFLMASCVTDRAAEAEPTMAASAVDGTEELDPNDPNVIQCPVTGAMELRKPGDEGYVHPEEHGGDY